MIRWWLTEGVGRLSWRRVEVGPVGHPMVLVGIATLAVGHSSGLGSVLRVTVYFWDGLLRDQYAILGSWDGSLGVPVCHHYGP
jgi:hypothetical protein